MNERRNFLKNFAQTEKRKNRFQEMLGKKKEKKRKKRKIKKFEKVQNIFKRKWKQK